MFNGVKLTELAEVLTQTRIMHNRNPLNMYNCAQNFENLLAFLRQYTLEKPPVLAQDLVLGKNQAACDFLVFVRSKTDLDYEYQVLLAQAKNEDDEETDDVDSAYASSTDL